MSHHFPRRILTRDDGAAIAYRHVPGGSSGAMFRTGLMSDMTGGKALCLEDIARHRRGAAFRRHRKTLAKRGKIRSLASLNFRGHDFSSAMRIALRPLR